MKPYKKYLALLALTFVFMKARSQDQDQTTFSLQQALEYALKHSPSYLNAELDLENSIYKKKETTGLGLPQINGSIDLKDYLSLPTSLLPGDFFGQPGTYLPVKFGTKYNATAGISASQMIFNSDYIIALKAAKGYLELSRIGIQRSKADLTAQVTKAYYAVVIAKDRLKLLDANLAKLQKTFNDTKAMNQQGVVELIDVERLEVQVNNLALEKEKSSRLIGLSELQLKFQMGIDLQKSITLTDSLRSTDNLEDLSLGAVDISQRPDYRFLQEQQKLYELDIRRYKLGYAPNLVAYGSYQYNAQRNTFNLLSFDQNDPLKKWFKIALIGATLNVPIFDGLQRHNKIQQAKMTSQKNINTLRMTELASQLEATSAAITYKNAFMSLSSQKRNMDLAQHVFDVTQKKYDSGVGSNLEVVTAQTALLEAQTNYFIAVYDATVAKIDYQKALGLLAK
jgi:outer membrane protein TolC